MRIILTRLSALALAGALMLSPARPIAQTVRPAMAGYPAVGAPATITLLTPGAAPRTALRYKVPVNTRERLAITTALTMSMAMEGMEMPPQTVPTMKMTADMAITAVSAAGDMNYEMTFTGLGLEGPGEANAAAMLQQASAAIVGLKASATTSPRGVVSNGRIDLDKVDPQIRQLLASSASSFETMSLPFPTEAVGVGARWEARQGIDSGGSVLFQKTVFEIIGIEGDTVRLKGTVEQTAPAQAVSNPALPAGATMQIESLTGTSSATMTVRLDSLVPTSEVTGSSTSVMVVSMNGQQQRMNVTTNLKMGIAPLK